MYLRGTQQLDDLGRGHPLGQTMFRNAAESVRISPFRIPLNCHVMKNDAGELAGGFAYRWEVNARLRSSLYNLNQRYETE
jgi:hypothetical protein